MHNFFYESAIFGTKKYFISSWWRASPFQNFYSCINAKAESPRLNLKAKASIWLWSHPRRSLAQLTKDSYMQNRSIERVIFVCLNSLYFKNAWSTKVCGRSRLLSILIEGRTKLNLTTFCRYCFFGVQINSSPLMPSLRSLAHGRFRHVIE